MNPIPTDPVTMKLLVRQTDSVGNQAADYACAAILRVLDALNGQPHLFEAIKGLPPDFCTTAGVPLTPNAYRCHSRSLLDCADAVINIRCAPSEGMAFELAYHLYHGAKTPVLMLVWAGDPIQATLLQELDAVGDVTYVLFDHPSQVIEPMARFIDRIAIRQGARRRLAGHFAPQPMLPVCRHLGTTTNRSDHAL